MRVRIDGLYAIIEEATIEEIEEVKSLLSWGDPPRKWVPPVTDFGELPDTKDESYWCLIMNTPEMTPYILAGSIPYLRDKGLVFDPIGDPGLLKPNIEIEKVPVDIIPGIKLYDYQEMSINKTIIWNTAIISSATGCFPGDTKIKTDKGDIRIRDLLEDYKNYKSISIDENGNEVLADIDDVFITKTVESLYSIVLESGEVITATHDHPIAVLLSKYGRRYKYKRIDEIKSNDIILTNSGTTRILHTYSEVHPNGIPVFDISIPKYNNFALESGVIAHNSGKTEITIAMIKHLLNIGEAERVVIVTPSVSLLDNMYERFKDYGFADEVDRMGGGYRPTLDKSILISSIGTMNSNIKKREGEIYDYISNADVLIFDEGHHCRAETFFRVALGVNPKRLYELSGTPFFNDDPLDDFGDSVVASIAGRVTVEITSKFLISVGILAKPYVFFKSVGSNTKFYSASWHTLKKTYLTSHKFRNSCIVEWAKLFSKLDMPTLIIVDSLDHQDILLKNINDPKCVGIKGQEEGKLYDSKTKSVDTFKTSYQSIWDGLDNGAYNIVIANYVADEGVNIPSVSAMILACGQKSIVKVSQRAGRAMRKKKIGNNVCFILDFYDIGHVAVKKHSNMRLGQYEVIGADVVEEQEFVDLIYKNHKAITEDS